MKWVLAVCALIIGGCTGAAETTTTSTTTPDTTTPPTTATATTTTTSTTSAPATTTTTEPPPELVPVITVTGPEEVVWDWTTDRCEDEHIPDIAARAFRDADGQVQLIIGHYVNYRSIGPDLESVATDCTGPMLVSDYDPDPSQFNDSEWIGSPFTLDGETVYAVIHNEYRGDTHNASRPGQCPSQERLTCLDTSLTMAISTDGGDTYTDILSPPNHLIATLPYTFDDEGVPSGLRQPSNIITGPNGLYYVFSNISDYPTEDQWVCAMRTSNLSDPASWRFWDGDSFTGQFVNPYTTEVDATTEKCAPLDDADLSGGVQETVVFDEVLGKYVMMGITFHPSTPQPRWGVYYSLSDDLIDWTQRELLLELITTPNVADPLSDLYYAYPSVIDPDSTSMSFETTDGRAYLYLTRFNAGGLSLDRDLVRWPIKLEYVVAETTEPPDWTFDRDTEGWAAEWALSPLVARNGNLVMESIADDPYFSIYNLAFPASNQTVRIRMKVSGTGETVTGQLFFGTALEAAHTEDKSLVFDVIADGEFQAYELDMSAVAGWDGTIVSLRIDPAPDSGRDIEVDRIWVR